MLIILEGPDCAGKSTLAAKLAAKLEQIDPTVPTTVIHRGPPTQHPLHEYVEPLLDYRPNGLSHIICDRWHIGELVYPTVLNRPTLLTRSVNAYIEAFLRSRGAYLAYCTAGNDYLAGCGYERGDDQVEIDRIAATTQQFLYAVTRSTLPRLVVNVHDDVTDDDCVDSVTGSSIPIVDQLLTLANDESFYADVLTSFTTYVGPVQPRLLLFGERRGPRQTALDDYGNWPAFAPFVGTSGRYLFEVLVDLDVPSHGLRLEDVGFANACDVDDPFQVWDAVGRPPVIALGNLAAKKLTASEVPFRHAAHPQYARRFKHHQQSQYLEQLVGAHVKESV